MTTFHLPPNKFRDSSTGQPTELGNRFTTALLGDTPNGSLNRAHSLRTLPGTLRVVVRENYARADVGGVVIVFECADAVEAKRYVADFPLSKANLIEWEFIVCEAPLPLE